MKKPQSYTGWGYPFYTYNYDDTYSYTCPNQQPKSLWNLLSPPERRVNGTEEIEAN
jgi:hypothetical protein